MSRDEPNAPVSSVDPRSGAVIARWAIRYSAGRSTGVHDDAIALTHMLAGHLRAQERDVIVDEARNALAAAQRNRDSGSRRWVNGDEPGRWQELIDVLTELDGGGDDKPVDVGLGRTLALCAVSAMRRVSGYSWSADEPDPATVQQVAEAIAAAAPQFRPSDRVLLMRDLREYELGLQRADPAAGCSPAWQKLYLTVGDMELDDDYARLNHLPTRLSGPSQAT